MQALFRTDSFRYLLLGLALGTGAPQAWAALGQAPSALVRSAAGSAAARKLTATPAVTSNLVTVHEEVLANGTTVQEYAGTTGLVFAVAWRGPVLPDLSALLGGYFSTFKAEADRGRALGKRGSAVHVARGDLVVSSNGRMRGFYGYAYAPELVPAGVNINDVLQ